jgi:hypothetical protein
MGRGRREFNERVAIQARTCRGGISCPKCRRGYGSARDQIGNMGLPEPIATCMDKHPAKLAIFCETREAVISRKRYLYCTTSIYCNICRILVEPIMGTSTFKCCGQEWRLSSPRMPVPDGVNNSSEQAKNVSKHKCLCCHEYPYRPFGRNPLGELPRLLSKVKQRERL